MYLCVAALTNGHAVAETVAKKTKKQDEQRLQAEREACLELMRRQMEEEREKRRAIVAEVGLRSRYLGSKHFILIVKSSNVTQKNLDIRCFRFFSNSMQKMTACCQCSVGACDAQFINFL